MKFTKVMALALALLMLVCAFAACGGDKEPAATDPVDTPPVTDPTGTEPTETDPTVTDPAEDEDCKHTRKREVPNSRVEPTCTTDGKYTEICRSCDMTFDVVLPAHHEYSPLKSTDGQYTKYFCSVCSDTYVEDANGEKVADPSAIEFPFFYTSFDDLADVKNIADKFEDIDYKDAFATQVVTFTDGEEVNNYANVPTGSSAQNSNGFFELADKNNAFASKVFTISFMAKFDEYPLTGVLDLLTWNIGGAEYKLLTVDGVGDVFVLGNSKAVATYSDKGWDKITVVVDPAKGTINVDFVGADGKTSEGTGKLGASVAGKTGSYVRFFDDQGQFEAYIDEVLMSVAK
ncbi:MAG: hypothetical protein IJW79_00815 [Clostridia bacterium]|nr:hypothetical protein [Clostridia bacterium]